MAALAVVAILAAAGAAVPTGANQPKALPISGHLPFIAVTGAEDPSAFIAHVTLASLLKATAFLDVIDTVVDESLNDLRSVPVILYVRVGVVAVSLAQENERYPLFTLVEKATLF